jgi:glycosyltransferase involved in cell wall biosynthesis
MEKKVLHLRSSIGFYGAESVISEICKELVNSTYRPMVGVIKNQKNPHTELHEFAISNGIDSKIFECRGALDLKSIFFVRNFIKSKKIDIIHTHGYKSNFYALFATLFYSIPLVATCHPWIISSNKGKRYSRLDKILLRKFDKIVSISEHVRQQLLNAGIPDHKITHIDNGININSYKNNDDPILVRNKYNIPDNVKVICSVGRLSKEKGHHILLDAAKRVLDRFPNTYFIFAGEGLLLSHLKSYAKRIGIDQKVHFPGFVKQIPKLLSAIDIFVLPSLTEGMPMALLEAMAAKKPVVSTNVGSIPQLISHDKTGLLVNPGDPIKLSYAIIDILQNENKADNLAEGGYHHVRKYYSSEQMTRKYINIYNSFSPSQQN